MEFRSSFSFFCCRSTSSICTTPKYTDRRDTVPQRSLHHFIRARFDTQTHIADDDDGGGDGGGGNMHSRTNFLSTKYNLDRHAKEENIACDISCVG